MKSDDSSMYDDPSTPAYMRELLHAGRRGQVDYDVERGLAEHLARIGATPISPAAQWGAGAAAAAKSTLPAWLGFVPLAAAGVAGLVWAFAAQPAAKSPNNAAPAGVMAPSLSGDVAPSAAPDLGVAIDDRGASEDVRAHAGPDRRSRGSRASAGHGSRGSRAVSGTRGAPDVNDSEVGFEAATSLRTDDSSSARDELASAPNPYVGQKTEAKLQPAREEAREAVREPAVEEQDDRPAAVAKPAAKPAGAVVVDESRLEREMQMLAVTQRVLASNPERALRLAQQGEREFAGSMFSAERRQLGLLALVKLGRLDDARRAGRPFLARYPKAPWSERLRRALATGTVE